MPNLRGMDVLFVSHQKAPVQHGFAGRFLFFEREMSPALLFYIQKRPHNKTLVVAYFYVFLQHNCTYINEGNTYITKALALTICELTLRL